MGKRGRAPASLARARAGNAPRADGAGAPSGGASAVASAAASANTSSAASACASSASASRAVAAGAILLISAAADADAEVTRAEGSRQAAHKLSEHEVAVQLAHISATGEALKKAKSSLILASEPAAMGSMMLANPSLKLA